MDFRKLIRLLAPLMVEGVLSIRRNSHSRLIEMLHELQFVTRSVTMTVDEVLIELQILDCDLLYRLLGGEANKFFLASRVSYERSNQGQPNNASWQAIEHYYAAYYAVHYLLRLTGVSVTNLDAQSISAIARSNYGVQSPDSIPTGLYVMRYDDSSKTLTLKKNLKKKKKGGSHHEAWQRWDELVDKLQSETDADPVEYASISIDLTEHKNFLVKSTAKYNPPEIRGEINYQFKGKAWVFEQNAGETIDRLKRSIANHAATATKASTPEGLIDNNKIIIGLAKAAFLRASERYPKGICRSIANKYSSYVT